MHGRLYWRLNIARPVITGSYGLGESVVGGKVDPDEVQVFKPMIGKAQDPRISRHIGREQTSIIYTDEQHYSQLHGRPTPLDIEWAKVCFKRDGWSYIFMIQGAYTLNSLYIFVGWDNGEALHCSSETRNGPFSTRFYCIYPNHSEEEC